MPVLTQWFAQYLVVTCDSNLVFVPSSEIISFLFQNTREMTRLTLSPSVVCRPCSHAQHAQRGSGFDASLSGACFQSLKWTEDMVLSAFHCCTAAFKCRAITTDSHKSDLTEFLFERVQSLQSFSIHCSLELA